MYKSDKVHTAKSKAAANMVRFLNETKEYPQNKTLLEPRTKEIRIEINKEIRIVKNITITKS
jgi:hypothetical protein